MKARGLPGKSRLLVGFGALLMLGVVLAIFHSSQQQVDELRTAGLRCEQHETALRRQFESELAKVGKLEESLETAKNRLKVEEKTAQSSNLRFSSLQQHYKLLQSEHTDIKQEHETSKQRQLEQTHNYEKRIKVLTSALAQSDKRRLDLIEQWKFKYTQLEIKFNKLEAAMNSKLEDKDSANLLRFKNQQLEEGLNEMQKHCAYRLDRGLSPTPESHSSSSSTARGQEVQRSFDEQVLVADNTYQIPIHIQSPATGGASSINNLLLQTSNRTMDLQRDLPPFNPLKQGGIINSVENFQMLAKPLEEQNVNENVLKEPMAASDRKDSVDKRSTPTLDKKEESLDRALPIAIIQQQVSKAVVHHSPSSTKARKVPDGVVPIPESMNAIFNHNEQVVKEGHADPLNGRYGNVADANNLHQLVEEDEEHNNPVNFLQNGNEVENGAHEVNDFNIIEDRNHHDHLQDVLDDEKIVINNNAAEVGAQHGEGGEGEKDKRNEIDLTIINRDLHDRQNGLLPKKGNDDFVADQGFDDHLEEHVEEEDDDEYSNLAARQEEGHAVRN